MSDLPILFQQMSELTSPVCAKDCPRPHTCCHSIHCEAAAKYAWEEYGIRLETTGNLDLPFMGPNGCTVAPHLRPKCTLHTCHTASLGFWPMHSDWNNKYIALRLKIEEGIRECKMNSAT